jgi:nitrate reductase gamma subunit
VLTDPNILLFAIVPYVAFALFFLVTIQRYRQRSFTYSSLSSQFLENKHHFWGSVPFHYGILIVLAGHAVAFLVPRSILLWNGHPVRLLILEGSALACAILTLVGLFNIILRRFTEPRCRKVTSTGDWIIYALLLVQIVTGIYVAIFFRWGSSWFASSATPYLWSLLKLNPEVGYLVALPAMIKLHIVNAFLIIAVFPFTRLVHILVIPNMYLWRKPQVVIWNRPRGQVVED